MTELVVFYTNAIPTLKKLCKLEHIFVKIFVNIYFANFTISTI